MVTAGARIRRSSGPAAARLRRAQRDLPAFSRSRSAVRFPEVRLYRRPSSLVRKRRGQHFPDTDAAGAFERARERLHDELGKRVAAHLDFGLAVTSAVGVGLVELESDSVADACRTQHLREHDLLELTARCLKTVTH